MLKSVHMAQHKTAEFNDDSYLQILSLPFPYNDRLKLKAFTGLRGFIDLHQERGYVYRKLSLMQRALKALF